MRSFGIRSVQSGLCDTRLGESLQGQACLTNTRWSLQAYDVFRARRPHKNPEITYEIFAARVGTKVVLKNTLMPPLFDCCKCQRRLAKFRQASHGSILRHPTANLVTIKNLAPGKW